MPLLPHLQSLAPAQLRPLTALWRCQYWMHPSRSRHCLHVRALRTCAHAWVCKSTALAAARCQPTPPLAQDCLDTVLAGHAVCLHLTGDEGWHTHSELAAPALSACGAEVKQLVNHCPAVGAACLNCRKGRCRSRAPSPCINSCKLLVCRLQRQANFCKPVRGASEPSSASNSMPSCQTTFSKELITNAG